MLEDFTNNNLKNYTLLKTKFNGLSYESVVEEIICYAKLKKSLGISSLAVHGLITAHQNRLVQEAVNKLDIVTPDGQPIRWALNFFFNLGLKKRVSGPDLVLNVLSKANEFNMNIFLYGSTISTLTKLSEFIKKNYSNIKIVGVHEDRFRDSTKIEDIEDIHRINSLNVDIVFVGRGCPRQEIWVANHIGLINAPMLAVGAAFDFHAGVLKKAPKWMEDNGFEWLFRLIQEPKRLWKRYLVTNTLFIYYVTIEILKNKLFNKS